MKSLKRAILPAIAAVMVLAAAASPSMSYFTTYVTAKGGHTLQLQDVHVDVDDQVEGQVKSITVTNTSDPSEPCYVRVKVLQANTAGVEAPIKYAGDGWSNGGDGYWYYSGILANKGDAAALLEATIDLPESSETKPIPEGTEFHVTVIAECAKIFYDENGEALANGPTYKGWTAATEEG